MYNKMVWTIELTNNIPINITHETKGKVITAYFKLDESVKNKGITYTARIITSNNSYIRIYSNIGVTYANNSFIASNPKRMYTVIYYKNKAATKTVVLNNTQYNIILPNRIAISEF